MARDYNLNPDAARDADSGGGRIDQSGAYIGKFTKAEAITSPKGTEGIEFSFEADGGATADFLTFWTHNKDGEEIFGFKALSALMTCLKARSIKPANGMVEKWNKSSGQKEKHQATIYPDLMNKRIGLVLQREEYTKENGQTGYKMNIYSSYEADTLLTASEILDKASKPERLDKIIATLRDKTQKQQSGNNHQTPSSNFDDFKDDDIPW